MASAAWVDAVAAADEPAKSKAAVIRCDDWALTPDGRWTPRPPASISTEDFSETTLLTGGTRVMGPKASAVLDRTCRKG